MAMNIHNVWDYGFVYQKRIIYLFLSTIVVYLSQFLEREKKLYTLIDVVVVFYFGYFQNNIAYEIKVVIVILSYCCRGDGGFILILFN